MYEPTRTPVEPYSEGKGRLWSTMWSFLHSDELTSSLPPVPLPPDPPPLPEEGSLKYPPLPGLKVAPIAEAGTWWGRERRERREEGKAGGI